MKEFCAMTQVASLPGSKIKMKVNKMRESKRNEVQVNIMEK